MSEILFFIACTGATAIICYSKIFTWARRYLPFLKCPMCVGMWFGFWGWPFFEHGIISLALYSSWPWVACFAHGLASSLISYFACSIINDDGIAISGRGLLDAIGSKLCQQQHKEIMTALESLNASIATLTSAVTAALAKPAGVPEVDVQAAADAVNVQAARLAPTPAGP